MSMTQQEITDKLKEMSKPGNGRPTDPDAELFSFAIGKVLHDVQRIADAFEKIAASMDSNEPRPLLKNV